MFEDADNFADIFRGGLPYYLLVTLPILIMCCSSNPVLASSEFTVQRMHQYDVHGVSYGCRTSVLNLEARSLYSWSTSRHCVVTRFQDLTIDHFKEIRSKAGGLIVLMPKDFTKFSFEDKQNFYQLEQAMLSQFSSIPIFFSQYTEDLDKIVDDITSKSSLDEQKSNNQRESALSEIFNSISANGYQVAISGSSHLASKQSKIPIIQGELAPLTNLKATTDVEAVNTKLPLIILVAHLNTFGLYNDYLYNVDAAVLLTLASLFSKMHNSINAAPKYRLQFLLSESGSLLNFQGMKKWLDENLNLQNIDFVMCLDTISQPIDNPEANTLFMHVSKPPKDGTAMNNFYQKLKTVASQYGNLTVEGVHKKINLADVLLAWEHERFSMKRMPAFTLSTLKSHKEPVRTTIFKDHSAEVLAQAQRNAKILSESLARFVYNIDEGEIFAGAMQITTESIKPYLEVKSALHNNDLKNAFEKYLRNVKIMYEKPDAREPDFMFYDGQSGLLNVYRVKPAVFDLFLTLVILAYLSSVYLVIQNFPRFYTIVCSLSNSKHSSSNSNGSASGGSSFVKQKFY